MQRTSRVALDETIHSRIKSYHHYLGVSYGPETVPLLLLLMEYSDTSKGVVYCPATFFLLFFNRKEQAKLRWELLFLITIEEMTHIKEYGFGFLTIGGYAFASTFLLFRLFSFLFFFFFYLSDSHLAEYDSN
jgi:hypothetical protein